MGRDARKEDCRSCLETRRSNERGRINAGDGNEGEKILRFLDFARNDTIEDEQDHEQEQEAARTDREGRSDNAGCAERRDGATGGAAWVRCGLRQRRGNGERNGWCAGHWSANANGSGAVGWLHRQCNRYSSDCRCRYWIWRRRKCGTDNS